jgi:hypothetical protein
VYLGTHNVSEKFDASIFKTRAKVKVKLSLSLIKHYAIKTYGGVEV